MGIHGHTCGSGALATKFYKSDCLACGPCITVPEQEPAGSRLRVPEHAMLWQGCVWPCGMPPSICRDSRAAMQRTGCSWTGLTVSRQQLEEAAARVKAVGLSDSIRLLFCDYREGGALGQFDKVRSCHVCWRAHP